MALSWEKMIMPSSLTSLHLLNCAKSTALLKFHYKTYNFDSELRPWQSVHGDEKFLQNLFDKEIYMNWNNVLVVLQLERPHYYNQFKPDRRPSRLVIDILR